MQYENPQPREGINYSDEHPLKEFAQLLLGVAMIIVIGLLMVNLFIGVIARQIPIEFENRMVERFEIAKVKPSATQSKLQALADKLSVAMDLPSGMSIKVHYQDDPVVNAFATLGGNVVFFRGLLEKLTSEQELAAVMGHEIAHIKYRHPITSLGKGITLATLVAFVSGASGSAAGNWLIGSSSNLGLMKFSRDQEREADQAAAAALQSIYGNIKGADALFQRFSEMEAGKEAEVLKLFQSELFRSHPYSDQRWQALKTLTEERGWTIEGTLTPLVFSLPEAQRPSSE